MRRKGKGVYFVTLGCSKNRVDTEHMLGVLEEKGFVIVSHVEEGHIAVVNTCGFIQPAVEEAIESILEMVNLKREGKIEKVFVTGCFVQRYGHKLLREIPEVDGWLGTGEVSRIGFLIDGARGTPSIPFFIGKPETIVDHTVPRRRTTPFYTAYLRIAEGCSHRCSFCMIPALRGTYRSRNPESLLEEARNMVCEGVKEINLVAQDTTGYGRDLAGNHRLEDLVEGLVQIRGLHWVRLLYCHPSGISERLLELMDSEQILCPYLDVPLQHVNNGLLKAMGRSYGKADIWNLVNRIRARHRKIILRTTLMVGFPGETEGIFEELYSFVKQAEFDHLGVFGYSREKGTLAGRLTDVVKSRVAKARRERLMRLQARIAKRHNQALVGKTLPVLLEGPSAETSLILTGRTDSMAPEVDGQVLMTKGQGTVGEIVKVTITDAHEYDLVGEIWDHDT